jgi:hypothetical protein
MRLTSALVERTLSQFEAEAIPDNHPVIPQLRGLFGDHTFFLDGNGAIFCSGCLGSLRYGTSTGVSSGRLICGTPWR